MSETISERSAKLYQILTGRSYKKDKFRLFDWEPLLDAFFALYDIFCNVEEQKKNKQVDSFVKKFRLAIEEVRKMRPSKDDFEFIRAIGRGHFGEVYVVKERNTDDIYAMKILKKAATLSNDNIAFYEEERDVMAFASSPWVTALQYAFQDTENLYLVMEFLAGGDLLNLLNKYTDSVMEEEDARFYLCEIILAVHSVHVLGYVHRDVKPENILIDMTGHVKLADFGSAARLQNGQTILCKMPVGTPEYIAPEVLQSMNKGGGIYGEECDWWSVGVMCYEMLCGCLPFEADGILKLYSQIMNFKESLEFPEDVQLSDHARSLIYGLLEDQKLRISYSKLAQHEFFENIDWTTLRVVRPPFIPQISNAADTSNFSDFRAIKPPISRPPQPTLSSTMPFIGFSFSKNISAPKAENLRQKISVSHQNSLIDDENARPKHNIQLSQLNQQIKDQFKKNQELDEDLKSVKTDISLKQQTIDELKSQKEIMTVKCSDLERKLESTLEQFQQSKILQSNIDDLQSQLKSQQNVIESLTGEKDIAISKTNSLIQKLEYSEKAREEAQQSLKSAESRSQAMQEELRFSIKELQTLLESTNQEYQERLKASFGEIKRYREIQEEMVQKVTLTEQHKQMTTVTTEELENLKKKYEDLEILHKNQQSELQNSQLSVLKFTQNNRELQQNVSQNDQKIQELVEKLRIASEQLDLERENNNRFLFENSDLTRLSSEKDKKFNELEKSVDALKISFENEKQGLVKEINKIQEELESTKTRLTEKSNEMTNLRASMNEFEREMTKKDSELSKSKQEIERLSLIVSAQKSSNFALSQDLEEANIRISCLEAENEELSTISAQLTSSHREQIFKLETTIGQQTKLINFLHTEASKKKGGKFSKPPPDNYGKEPSHNQRRARDVEQQLELERMQTLKLNTELDALRLELKILKADKKSGFHSSLDKKFNTSEQSLMSTINEKNEGHVSQKSHSFISTFSTIPNICFVCLAPITFSQPILKCSNCFVILHPSCQVSIPYFSCKSHSLLTNMNGLFNFSNIRSLFTDIDEFEPFLPFTGCLSIPHQVGHNKFEWHKRMFQLSSTTLTISNTEDMDSDIFGRINFKEMSNPCLILPTVHTSDIFFTPLANWPFVFGIQIPRNESSHYELNMSLIGVDREPSTINTVLFMLAETLEIKRIWVRLLTKVVNQDIPHKIDLNSVSMIDTQQIPGISAIEPIGSGQFLIGHQHGVTLYNFSEKISTPCFDNQLQCHCLHLTSSTLLGIFGPNRELVRLKPDKVKDVFHITQKKPFLTPVLMNGYKDCFYIFTPEQKGDNIIVIISHPNEICGARIFPTHSNIFRIPTNNPPSSIVIIENKIIFSQDKFYIFDIEKKVKKEFLDSSDNSLAFLVYGSSSESNYPMSIFNLNHSSKNHFLLCYSEFGLIVNEVGGRVSSGDIRWDELPLSFKFSNDTLWICYRDKMEQRIIKPAHMDSLNEKTSPIYYNIRNPLIFGSMTSYGPTITHIEDSQLVIFELTRKSITYAANDHHKDQNTPQPRLSGIFNRWKK